MAVKLLNFSSIFTIVVLLVEGLVEKNHTADVFGKGRVGSEEQLAVETAVFLDVLHSDVGQTLAHGACDCS